MPKSYNSESTELEIKLLNEITIYGNKYAVAMLKEIVNLYLNLWINIGNVTLPESQYLKISLLNNWRDNYKVGLIKIYLVGNRNEVLINKTFNKLYKQKRLI